ncbi:MAG: DNA double-strand break repair protein Mre11, partial [Dehalococcoidia bacterium]
RLLREAEALDESVPSLLTAHVSISQATLGSERTMMVGSDHVLILRNVALPAFDYVALGHIHRKQVLNEAPPVVYCGSLQRVDFSEEKDEKGFYIVDLDPSRDRGQRVTSYQFHRVKARPFVTVDIDIKPDDPDPITTVLQGIQRHPVADAIVRVRVKVPAELEEMVREAEIRKALRDAHFVASIAREVERDRPIRLEGRSVESMSPLDALKAYIESVAEARGWTEQQVKDLLEHGEALIRETTSPAE